MSLPMNLDFKGGSSEAKAELKTQNDQTGGGGVRGGGIINIATGASRLSSSAANEAGSGQSMLLLAGVGLAAVYLLNRKR